MGTPSATVYVDLKGTPHAFIKLDDGNGNVKYYGFAPATPGSPAAPGQIGVGLSTQQIGDPTNSTAGYIDDVAWAKTISLSPAQYLAMDSKVSEWRANTPDYRLFGTNCTSFVKDVLEAGGAKYPGITFGPSPFNLIPNGEQGTLITVDPGTGQRNFSSAISDPSNTPGTPAYDAKQNPAGYGLPAANGTPSTPATSPVSMLEQQDPDGSWHQRVVFANGSVEMIDSASATSIPICRREDYALSPVGLPTTSSYTFRAGFDSELTGKEVVSVAGNGLTTQISSLFDAQSHITVANSALASTADLLSRTTTAQQANGTYVQDAWYYNAAGIATGHEIAHLRANKSMMDITAYDASGQADTSTTFSPDGSSVVYDYDQTHSHTWQTLITAYDTQHRIDTVTYYNWDKTINAYDFDNGNTQADWDWFAVTYDDAGRADTVIYHYDATNAQLWIDLDQDQGGAANKDFTSINTYVDGQGRLDNQTIYLDSGAKRVTDWDQADNQSWNVMETLYTAGGQTDWQRASARRCKLNTKLLMWCGRSRGLIRKRA